MNKMNKMNNKGFAITTLLYGLLSVAFLIMTLLMGIMSQNRQNTSNLVDKIEEELNRYGETDTTFAFLGESQEYIVPYNQSGWYKVELWGAKTDAGYGDYVSGLIYLQSNTHLYFYLGAECATASACSTAFNKGNTEVRIENALWTDAGSQRSTFIRAGGKDSTFISGVGGSNLVDEFGSLTYQTNHYSDKYFINGLNVSDANAGSGMANIEMVYKSDSPTDVPNMKSTILNSVRYIQDCATSPSGDGLNHIVEIQAISVGNGSNLAIGKTISNVSGNADPATDGIINSASFANISTSCTVLDLGADYALSEIAVWHKYSDGRAYNNHTISVKSSSGSYTYLKNVAVSGVTQSSEKETVVGYHYTPWQPFPTSEIASGNYYIMSTAQNNAALNSAKSGDLNVNTINFTASRLQKWTVEEVDINSTLLSGAIKAEYSGRKLYKIFDAENKHALQIQEVGAERRPISPGSSEEEIYKWISEESTNVNASKQYSGGGAWELWEIVPLGNGTYNIKSVVQSSAGTGNMFLTNSNENSFGNVVARSGSAGNFSRRWKFVNADY